MECDGISTASDRYVNESIAFKMETKQTKQSSQKLQFKLFKRNNFLNSNDKWFKWNELQSRHISLCSRFSSNKTLSTAHWDGWRYRNDVALSINNASKQMYRGSACVQARTHTCTPMTHQHSCANHLDFFYYAWFTELNNFLFPMCRLMTPPNQTKCRLCIK